MRFASCIAVVLGASVANAFPLTETFPDPLGDWKSNWFGLNSDAENYYTVLGYRDVHFHGDQEDFRGNNPVGLWIAQGPTLGGRVLDITFDPTFASSLTYFKMELDPFFDGVASLWDTRGNLVSSKALSDDSIWLNHEVTLEGASSVGIEKIRFESSSFDVEGHLSVDNLTAVPEPMTFLAIGGALAFAARRRRK